MVAAHVVMHAGRDARHAARYQVALGGMEVAARGIAAQRPGVLAIGLPCRQPERELEQGRDRIEAERMRGGQPAAAQSVVARVEMVGAQRQLDALGAFVAAEGIRLVGPVEPAGPRRVPLQAVLAALVVIPERVCGHDGDDSGPSLPHRVVTPA
jgi:hypothetical protein